MVRVNYVELWNITCIIGLDGQTESVETEKYLTCNLSFQVFDAVYCALPVVLCLPDF